MPRPKRIRRISNPPHFKGFIPIGLPKKNIAVVLFFEEYEAIKLSDFKLLGQVEASEVMGISRPTFARIYESARRKVAEAFFMGKPIIFEGGKVYFDSDWYSCLECGCSFSHPAKDVKVTQCALCGSSGFEQYKDTPESIKSKIPINKK